MKRFLVLLYLSLAACVVEPSAEIEDTDDASLSALTEMASTERGLSIETGLSTEMGSFTETGSFTKAGQGTQSLTCYETWYCKKCGINQRRNVLHEQCDDGSDTIIYTGPCGEPCF